MKHARNLLACGVVRNADGEAKSVVVPGGSTSESAGQDVVEILDVGTMTWRFGKHRLPHGLFASTAVPYGNSFLLVGGLERHGGPAVDAVYKFDPETENWILMPQRLNRPKHAVGAVLVRPDEFPACN